MRQRLRVVHTRITEEQYQKLVSEAERQGVTVGHLIRRLITQKESLFGQNRRSYTPKHGRRIRLTLQQRRAIAEKYIREYPELLKRVVQQMPQVREPPKTTEELANIIVRDTMESQMRMAEVYQDVLKTMREVVQRRFKRVPRRKTW